MLRRSLLISFLSCAFFSNILFSNNVVAKTPAPPANPKVTIETSKGKIVVELFADKAPVTVANFLHYVDLGFYNGTLFHRVIPNFMIQGGGFDIKMTEKPTGEPIKNESNNMLGNERGTLAMARTGDPNSATAQFFINLRVNEYLDFHPGQPGYAVFGKVIEGMNVVDEIAKVETKQTQLSEALPLEPVLIQSMKKQ